MTSPALELQGMIYATLQANAGVTALVDGVYDQPPNSPWGGPANAYISFGPSDALMEDADGILIEEHTFQIDVWSRTTGSVQCKKICDAVKRALHEQDLELTDNALVEIALKMFRVLRDPDGLTTHGVMQFSVTVEEDG